MTLKLDQGHQNWCYYHAKLKKTSHKESPRKKANLKVLPLNQKACQLNACHSNRKYFVHDFVNVCNNHTKSELDPIYIKNTPRKYKLTV